VQITINKQKLKLTLIYIKIIWFLFQ
jgi:hypothetical protein